MPLRLAREDDRQVGTDHEPGHAGVPAEELVGDLDHPDVVAPERGEEGAQHLSAVASREHPDRCLP
jgi:hypothetical protein